MKVLGLLSFYDEKPEHLTDAVSSLARNGVDHLVAVDGAYGLYPNPQASSPTECHDAIRDASREGGIGFTLHVPPAPWQDNEIEKRTMMFRVAHGIAEPYDDWLFVLDADEYVREADDYRAILETTSLDVASVMHGEQGVRERWERRLYRAHPQGITVRHAHYMYFDGEGRNLWGPRQIPRAELPGVHVWHRPWDRSKDRRRARNQYYEHRLTTHAEREFL